MLGTAACGPEAPDATLNEGAAVSPPSSQPADSPSRPTTRVDTLYLEGTAETMELRLLAAPDLPFSFYVPTGDFRIDTLRGPVEGVRLEAAFGGTLTPEAFVAFAHATAEGPADLAALRDYITTLLEDNDWQVLEPDPNATPQPCPWTRNTITFKGEDAGLEGGSGYACLGTHDGRPFYLLTHIPIEYAEGFGPRLTAMTESFRWRDSGAGLN